MLLPPKMVLPFKMFAHCHVAPICHKICHCWIGVSECANGVPEILCKVPSICVSKCCLQMNRGSRLVCQSVLADAGCRWGVVASQGVLSDGAIVLLPSNTVCLLYELPPRALPESPSKSGTCAKCTFHVAGKQYWCRWRAHLYYWDPIWHCALGCFELFSQSYCWIPLPWNWTHGGFADWCNFTLCMVAAHETVLEWLAWTLLGVH